MEFIPGALLWATFALIIILTFIAPTIVANFLIIYAIFWLVRSFMMAGRLFIGYRQYRHDVRQNWRQKLIQDFPKKWQHIYHLVIVATYKEDQAIVDETITAISQVDFLTKNIILVLATEERDGKRVRPIAQALQDKFKTKFKDFLITEHPQDIPGEVIGKGANITWAAKQAKKYIDQEKIPYSNIICTTLDADNRVHKKYFSAITYAFLAHPEPLYATFQPIPMFINNIWYVPMAIRSIALGSSFWQMIESTRPYRLRNFSAHAQSFAALVKTNFWSTKTIVEDGHQFWRTYFRFNGKHDVVPINVPIYQDAVLSPKGYWATFQEQYLQKRRWAWGCSDIPYVLHRMWGNAKLPFWDKWLQFGRLLEGHFSWASTSIILAFFSWLPPLLNPEFTSLAVAHIFPNLYGRILTASLLGLVFTLYISMILLPPKPKNLSHIKSSWSLFFEWISAPIVLPLSNIFFSAIPAIDSQTRLMLGKYLEFRVTEKHSHRQDLSQHRAAQ